MSNSNNIPSLSDGQFEQCKTDLETSDINNDYQLSKEEYLHFLSINSAHYAGYSLGLGGIAGSNIAMRDLPLGFSMLFHSTACSCAYNNDGFDCCAGDNGHIIVYPINGMAYEYKQEKYTKSFCAEALSLYSSADSNIFSQNNQTILAGTVDDGTLDETSLTLISSDEASTASSPDDNEVDTLLPSDSKSPHQSTNLVSPPTLSPMSAPPAVKITLLNSKAGKSKLGTSSSGPSSIHVMSTTTKSSKSATLTLNELQISTEDSEPIPTTSVKGSNATATVSNSKLSAVLDTIKQNYEHSSTNSVGVIAAVAIGVALLIIIKGTRRRTTEKTVQTGGDTSSTLSVPPTPTITSSTYIVEQSSYSDSSDEDFEAIDVIIAETSTDSSASQQQVSNSVQSFIIEPSPSNSEFEVDIQSSCDADSNLYGVGQEIGAGAHDSHRHRPQVS